MKKIPPLHPINWYHRNYCQRKCYSSPHRIYQCCQKLKLFADKNKNLLLIHREFLDLFNNHLKICTLPKKEKRRFVSWKEFERKTTKPCPLCKLTGLQK